MINDAHVHVGYFSRRGWREPFYYSPRRILSVLNRCGVGNFIVSSTCAQIRELKIADIIREAREIKRLAGGRAHIFFWLSGHLYDEDRTLGWLKSGLFDGIKFHECETPWVEKRERDLLNILKRVEDYNLPVQFHSGKGGNCTPEKLASVARRFPKVRFDFAHCLDMKEMSWVMSRCPNVWTDTAYLPLEQFTRLKDYDWHGRLMFGTDLPVWQAHEDCSLTTRYREYCEAFSHNYDEQLANRAFADFLNGRLPKFRETATINQDERK